MFSKTTVTTLLLIGARGALAQCDPITAQETYGATASVTVSAATRATITDPGRAFQGVTILSCAEATVGPSATVNILGGSATLSGLPASSAVANVLATAVIQNPTYASINVNASQGVEVYQASNVQVVIAGPSATALVIGTNIRVDSDGDNNFVNMLATSGDASLNIGGDSTGVFSLNGPDTEDIKAWGYAGANLGLFGRGYMAFVYEGALGRLFNSGIACRAAEGGTCLALDSTQTVIAEGGGFAVATDGTSNIVRVSNMGSGQVGGSGNSGVVESGGILEVTNTARADVRSGALATIYEGVSDVSVSSGATATMYDASEVTAAPGAFLRAGISTTIESVSEAGGGLTVFQARRFQAPSGAALEERNAKRAQPTGRCTLDSELCPNLRGIFGCVDTQTDIFNCGGCGLASGPGRDCTQFFDGALSCVRGACVAL